MGYREIHVRLWAFVISQKFTNLILAIIAALNFYFYFHIGAKDNFVSDFDDNLYITQEWGILHFNQFINIKNIGKETGSVSKIKAYIRSKDSGQKNFEKQLLAKDFIDETTQIKKPLLDIPLNSTEYFYTQLDFYNPIERFEDDSTTILNNKYINEIEIEQKKASINRYVVKDISPAAAKEIKNFITKRMSEFRQGEYEYIVELFKDGEDEPFNIKCYSFTIYQANIEALRETIKIYTEFYAYNNSGVIPRPAIKVKLTHIDDIEEIKSLKKEVK
jgi:hypothetical protein